MKRSPGRAYASGATTFYRLQRRMDSLDRSYTRALRELQRLQAIEEVAQVPDLRPQKLASFLKNPQSRPQSR